MSAARDQEALRLAKRVMDDLPSMPATHGHSVLTARIQLAVLDGMEWARPRADVSAPEPSTDGYVAAFYEIAEMLGIGAKTYSPKDAFERDIKPRLARLMKTEAALMVARRTIIEGGQGGVCCTVWVPNDISPAETLVDYIDAALSTGEAHS